MTLLVLIVTTALSVSFLCSILEAGLFSARMPELLARRERGDRGATLLLDLKTTRMDDAISAILILNTIAHTIGATLAGAQAAVVSATAGSGSSPASSPCWSWWPPRSSPRPWGRPTPLSS